MPSGKSGLVDTWAHAAAPFGRQHHSISEFTWTRRQPPANNLLSNAADIDISSINKVAACINECIQNVKRYLFWRFRAKIHGSKCNLGYDCAGTTELRVFDSNLPFDEC
jgi:hypothetical protein